LTFVWRVVQTENEPPRRGLAKEEEFCAATAEV